MEMGVNEKEKQRVEKGFVENEWGGEEKRGSVVKGRKWRAINDEGRRGKWKKYVRVKRIKDELRIASGQTTLAFALQGAFRLASGGTLACVDTLHLSPGDSVELEDQNWDAVLYVSTLS